MDIISFWIGIFLFNLWLRKLCKRHKTWRSGDTTLELECLCECVYVWKKCIPIFVCFIVDSQSKKRKNVNSGSNFASVWDARYRYLFRCLTDEQKCIAIPLHTNIYSRREINPSNHPHQLYDYFPKQLDVFGFELVVTESVWYRTEMSLLLFNKVLKFIVNFISSQYQCKPYSN